jgi:hypothetical protein
MVKVVAVNQQYKPIQLSNQQKRYYDKSQSFINQPLADVIEFRGKKQSKLERFNALPKHEQQNIRNAIKSMCAFDPDLLLTLDGKRPGTLCCMDIGPIERPSPFKKSKLGDFMPAWAVPHSCFKSFERNKNLLETRDLKIITEDDPKSPLVIFIHLPEARKVVQENLNIFRYRLDNDDLTVDQVLTKLLGKNSPLFSNNCKDLLGMIIGYPPEDAMMYNLSHEVSHGKKVMQERGAKIHERILASIVPILRPDWWEPIYITAIGKDGKQTQHKLPTEIDDLHLPEGAEEVYNVFYEALEIPVPDDKLPLGSPIGYVCWDSETKTATNLREHIVENFKEARQKFQKPADVWNYLLQNK